MLDSKATQMAIEPRVWMTFDIGSVLVLAVSVAKTFEWFEGALNNETRVGVREWLTNIRTSELVKPWPTALADAINRIFGRRALSPRFIVRSSIASVLALFLIGFAAGRRYGFNTLYTFSSPFGAKLFLGLPLISNLVPDYFSLLASRWILRLMGRRSSFRWTVILLILDLVLTSFIATISICLAWTFATWLENAQDRPELWNLPLSVQSDFFVELVPRYFTERLWHRPFMLVLFFSSFFTSIWVWLYAVSSFAVKQQEI